MDKDLLIRHFIDTDVDILNILKAQDIAKKCLEHMASFLRPGMERKTIREECAGFMTDLGSEGWWIHNDPALILYGDLTAYSAHEDPSPLFEGKKTGENDLITIDVAPMINTGWGDLARSFIMENGRIIDWRDSKNEEILQGMEMEMKLHELFINGVNEKTTFDDLYHLTDDFLKKHHYHNCDYHDNFGHSIENHEFDRIPINKGNNVSIASYNKPITYEPHICKDGGTYGLKYENMYVFIDGKMREI